MTPTTLPPCAESMRGGTRDWPIEVRALLEGLQRRKLKPERARRPERKPFLFEAAVEFDHPQRRKQRIIVHTRDRTDSRIAFLTDRCFELGQLVELDFSGCDATAPLGRIPGRVRRCKQFHEGWFDCVIQLGETARRPMTWWERALHWLGEATGFGPDDRRGHGGPRRRAA